MRSALAVAVVAGSVVVALLGPVGAAAQGTAAKPPLTLYVANSGGRTVTPIDTATNRAGRPITVGADPGPIAIAPHGRFAYVIVGQREVVPINLATHKPGRPIKLHGRAFRIAITPNGETVYVLDNNSVVPINTATDRSGRWIRAGFAPNQLALTPNGKKLYVTDFESDVVIPISTATNRAEKPIKVCSGPFEVAITPNSKTALVISEGRNIVTPINTATNKAAKPIPAGDDTDAVVASDQTAYVLDTGSHETVTPVSLLTRRPGKPITTKLIGSGSLVLSPDGRKLYIIPYVFNDDVIPIRTATGTALKPILVGDGPATGLMPPDGKILYVASGPGIVTPIVVSTDTALKPIKVGVGPDSMAFGR
jgi:YVTN family beta-propeller protein